MDKAGDVQNHTGRSDGIESEKINEVDLYSDVLSLVSEPEQNSKNEEREIYESENTTQRGKSIEKMGNECRFEANDDEFNQISTRKPKRQVLIGNLLWWTTDEDIKQALIGIGASDFDEIKFFENRINGQSKGYCVITCYTEECYRLVNRHLTKSIINGVYPLVSNATKSALEKFEAQSYTRHAFSFGDIDMNRSPTTSRPPMPSNFVGLRSPNDNGPRPVANIRHAFEQFRGLPPVFANGAMGPQRPLCPPGIRPGNPAMFGGLRLQMMNGGAPGRVGIGPLPPHPNATGSLRHDNPRERPPMYNNEARFPFHPPEPRHQGHMFRMPRQMMSSPTPHLNPSFMQNVHNQPTRPPIERPEISDLVSRSPSTPEEEVEEIMVRNRKVSSAASARAIADAAEGDYSGAFEVLITAINLIQLSKIGHDPRCQVLIGSLKDILDGIKMTSSKRDASKYEESRKKSRRSRSRSRGRSRAESRDRRGERELRDIRRAERNYNEEPVREYGRESDREYERGRSRHDRGKLESFGRRIPEYSSEFDF